MPEASTEFAKIEKSVHSMAHSMEATHSASKQTSDALGSLLKTLLVVDVTLKGLERVSSFSPMARNLREAFGTLGRTRDELRAMYADQVAYLAQQLREGKITSEMHTEELEKLEMRAPVLRSQLALEEQINKVGALRLTILAATVTALGRLFYISQDFNESNIKANAEWSRRRDLFYTNLQVQRETGVAFRSVAEAQRELVNYGFQNRQNYDAVVKTVVMLHEGLGMSVRAATDLAVVTERQVKVSFKSTVDVVAQLVDQTSLAADEVERIAKTLGPLILAIQPRGAPAFPQIIQALGQYEDAIKRLGGMGDEFTQMIAKMLKPEGLLQAGVLGIRDPQMLIKASGVKQAMDAFRKYTDQMLGSATGVDRVFRMQMLADTFGTSYEQMSLMVEAAKKANTAMNERTTLEDRFHQQMQAAGEGFKRIYSSITALLERALYPAIIGINWLTNFIANMLQTILKYKPLVFVAVAAIDLVIVMTILKLRSVAKAFWEVVMAAQMAAINLKRYAEGQLAQQAMGALPGGALKQGERAIAGAVEVQLGEKAATTIASVTAAKTALSFRQQFGMLLTGFGTQARDLWMVTKSTAAGNWRTMFEKVGLVFTEARVQGGLLRGLIAVTKAGWIKLGEQIGMLAVFSKAGLMAGLTSLRGVLLTGLTWLLRGLAVLLSPLGAIVALIGSIVLIASLIARHHARNLEAQMALHARMVTTSRSVEDSVKAQIYMATRAGDRVKAQQLMDQMVTMIRERKGSFQTLTPREAALEAAKFTDSLKPIVQLAQYTSSQFEKIKMTPAEREAQTKDNLEFQQKIADNTKKSLDEARRAFNEEKNRDEAERQAREMRYLRDGGVVGRYSWA